MSTNAFWNQFIPPVNLQRHDLLMQYLDLPAPVVLPSGLPNVWSLRMYCTQQPFPASILKPHPSRQEGDMLDGIIVELTPFDMTTGKPYLIGVGRSIVDMHVVNTAACIAAGLPASITEVSRFASRAVSAVLKLFTTFVNDPATSFLNEHTSPELLCIIPRLGTFRPHSIVVHDTAFLPAAFADQCAHRGHPEVVREFNLAVLPGGNQSLKEHIPTCFLITRCGMVVCCSQCKTVGTERAGHSILPIMQKCSGCSIAW